MLKSNRNHPLGNGVLIGVGFGCYLCAVMIYLFVTRVKYIYSPSFYGDIVLISVAAFIGTLLITIATISETYHRAKGP
jgi:hypothetical protein